MLLPPACVHFSHPSFAHAPVPGIATQVQLMRVETVTATVSDTDHGDAWAVARKPRNAYPGGFYHVGTLGNNRCDIYRDGVDRYWFLEMFGKTTVRYGWIVYAYCLMTTHYHAVVEIPEDGLSKGMCELNGGFARWANMRNDRENHLFGKRFSSVEIVRDSHLREAVRYVVLN